MDPLDALMKAAVDAIIIIDHAGTVKRFNPAAERMFGYTEAEITGRNVSLLMPDHHREQHDGYIQRYLQTGQAAIIGKGREEMGRRREGDLFPMALSVGRIEGEGTPYFVGIIKDLTDYQAAKAQVRQLEEQLLHADRLVILGELTAGIAHEINQPLTAIAAYADAGRKMVSQTSGAHSDELQTVCARISEQSRRAGEVVQRLRRLVRSGAVAKGRHDLNQIVTNTLLLFEYELKRTNITLEFKPMKSLDPLYVDEIQVQQILVNLVKNSLDALLESGREDGRILIDVSTRGQQVMISVTDNGPGVPEALQARLFDSFFTTKPKGVGLGLSICKNIAGAHGGNLVYRPAENGGSRFILSLPLEMIG